MANIGVRSPRFITVGSSGKVRFELNVTINGTLRYELFKIIDDSATFEISELIRDYITNPYNGTMPSATAYTTNSNGYVADVSLSWSAYTNEEGTGTPAYTGGTSLVAYDGYKFFDESLTANYDLPSTAVLLTSKTIWLPEDTAGVFYYTSTDTLTKYDIGTTTKGDISVAGDTVTIKRQDCSKYDPIKLVFVNKFGILQQLWFFGKTTESSSVENEQYKSADISASGSYSPYKHQFKRFNSNGKKSYVLNSAFVDETYNDSVNELLLSEQVWMHINSAIVPINIITSDVTYRTSLNDKMVQYTIEVEKAYDLISTMR